MKTCNRMLSDIKLSISVGVCTYNSGKYLSQQLDSILAQTIPVGEIVVIDDASTDETIAVLNSYSMRYPGIFRIEKNGKNKGARKNFEQLLSLCKGDVIFLSDHDDSWNANKVEMVAGYFNTHPADKVVFTNAVLMDEEGKELPATLWDVVGFPREVRAFAGTREDLLRFLLKHGRIVTGATVAIRKDFVEKLIPFRLMHKIWHDAWIALVAANARVLAFIDEPLMRYRVHSKQQVGWGYMQKINSMAAGNELVSELTWKELNGQCEEGDYVRLVHLRRKRVRLIKRLKRFIQLDKHITDEIMQECKQAERAFHRAKPLPARIAETIRKMFK